MASFYSQEELLEIGFKKVGENVKISRYANIYSPNNMEIGDNVRIDDFCILSGNIEIGNYVHISAYASLFAGESRIKVEDFVAISSRCAVYAVSDDYSGEYMTNPMVSEEYTNVTKEEVIISKHVIIGSGSTVLPGVVIETGAAIGAMSLVNKKIDEWSINVGIPSKKIKERSKNLLALEKEFIEKFKECWTREIKDSKGYNFE